jgi:hypothetical protein
MAYIIKQFPFHMRIFIELPFFEVSTSILNRSIQQFVYEILCFKIKIFKWRFEIQITSDIKTEKKRREFADCGKINGVK